MKTFYFTATGNCLYAAMQICGTIISIPRVLKQGITSFEDEKIAIVVPCYYFGTPRIVQKFLQTVRLKAPYIAAIMSYGNFLAAGIHDLGKHAERNGIALSYSKSILMTDNYLPLFRVEDQLKLETSKKIPENLGKIADDIKNSSKMIEKISAPSKIFSSIFQFFYRKSWGKKDRNFWIDENCNGCKICEQVCPVDNIKVEKKPIYHHDCEECLGCIHLCPQNAIHLKKERGSGRFRNSNVTVKEIIDSNTGVPG